jgi:hypothetical protein
VTHLRGRVRFAGQYARGKRVWLIEVVNTTTGKVVHRDDTCDLSRCCDAARDNVEVCRAAWIMGIKASDLKAEWVAS